jgi:hypothetical protein
VIAVIAFAAVQAGRRHPGRTRAMLTGTAAGLVFGIQDALTRQTLQILGSSGVAAMFTTWAPYALVGAGAIGIWLMQSAFNAGPLPHSLPAIAAGEPLVGLLLGALVFGDRIQISSGELALQAGGIVALVAGVILVGRAPALSQLRAWTPSGLTHIADSLPSLPALPTLPTLPNLPTLPALPALPGHGHGHGGRARRHASEGHESRGPGSSGPGSNGPGSNGPGSNGPGSEGHEPEGAGQAGHPGNGERPNGHAPSERGRAAGEPADRQGPEPGPACEPASDRDGTA